MLHRDDCSSFFAGGNLLAGNSQLVFHHLHTLHVKLQQYSLCIGNDLLLYFSENDTTETQFVILQIYKYYCTSHKV